MLKKSKMFLVFTVFCCLTTVLAGIHCVEGKECKNRGFLFDFCQEKWIVVVFCKDGSCRSVIDLRRINKDCIVFCLFGFESVNAVCYKDLN